MNPERLRKNAYRDGWGVMILAAVILLAGLLLSSQGQRALGKALTGLSFVPATVGGMLLYKAHRLKQNPEGLRSISIEESDERLLRLKGEADSRAFALTCGFIFLVYLGYTLAVPADIFEAPGWWLILLIMMMAFFSQGILLKLTLDKEKRSAPPEEE